ncbi:hypothetical protein Kpho02_60950 [Kitasatospora phosalacinea]|uniref:Uncharacterized protein n=1 Tax=Kitasatospora phosalacinea TaxID=2065 RepID=A0A9W6QFZ8_9ACTN|nr:hypothetical protein Kpho02_60950 [Kitasatospora phosalacinea]
MLHNWSGRPAEALAPVALGDVLSAEAVPAGGAVRLGARDVRVFVAA